MNGKKRRLGKFDGYKRLYKKIYVTILWRHNYFHYYLFKFDISYYFVLFLSVKLLIFNRT